ncbi:hypothetical protein [Pseudoteredinibacter isoporae]|uniref:hypothetical protein n=1 Tax=Pseudoteredinibacter isoporae TaxID=570281 RepID=UPI003102E139
MLAELPHSDIADSISQAIHAKSWTLEECCEQHNRKYKKAIENREVRALNKDFLSRVKRKKFEVLSPRILKLCEFLEVRTTKQKNNNQPLVALSEQIIDFEKYLSENPLLVRRFGGLMNFLAALTASNDRDVN